MVWSNTESGGEVSCEDTKLSPSSPSKVLIWRLGRWGEGRCSRVRQWREVCGGPLSCLGTPPPPDPLEEAPEQPRYPRSPVKKTATPLRLSQEDCQDYHLLLRQTTNQKTPDRHADPSSRGTPLRPHARGSFESCCKTFGHDSLQSRHTRQLKSEFRFRRAWTSSSPSVQIGIRVLLEIYPRSYPRAF